MTQRALIALSLLIAVGCQSMGESRRSGGPLDDGLLQYVGATAQGDIKVARIEHIEAQDATAAAVHKAKHSVDDRRVLQAELRAAHERVTREEERLALSVQFESEPTRTADIQAAVEAARTAVEVAEKKVALHEARTKELTAQVALSKAEEAHAAAVIDLRKARALATLERPETAAIDVDTYERVERECETEIELAKTVLRAAQREVMIAEEKLGGARPEAPERK